MGSDQVVLRQMYTTLQIVANRNFLFDLAAWQGLALTGRNAGLKPSQ